MKNQQGLFPVYTEVANVPFTICKKLDAEAFNFPFFNDGVQRNSISTKYKLGDIALPPQNQLLELKGFIFHTSHCGSTLLSRMLNESAKIRVVSETEAINGLLLAYVLYQLPKKETLEQLNYIVDAYRQPIGEEKHLIFKLTSWNVFVADLFLELFPNQKWIYIDRNSDEVVKSLQNSNGGMEDWFYHPVDVLRRHFIAKDYSIKNKEEYLHHLVEQHRKNAYKFKNENLCLLTYPDFVYQLETTILPHLKLECTEQDIDSMCKMTRFNAKSYLKVPYMKA